MVVKKVVNKKVISFDFCMDITKDDLLSCICAELHIQELFIEIYTIEKNEISISQKLLQMGIDTVYISYKKGFEDVAIRMNASELPLFFSALSEYNFDEITVWSANERWEQHLFLKSARQKNIVETENDLYLCYNYSEKRVELYLNPNYDAEKVNSIINRHTV